MCDVFIILIWRMYYSKGTERNGGFHLLYSYLG